METIASFIVSAMRLPGTTQRRCVKIHAIGLPSASTIVEMTGTSPSKSCADSWAVLSESRLTIGTRATDERERQRRHEQARRQDVQNQLGWLRRCAVPTYL